MALADYGYKRKIIIDHLKVDATETNYPAMSKFYSDSSVPAWTSSAYVVGNIVKNNSGYYKCATASTAKEPGVTASWQDDWIWLGDEFDFTKIQSDGKDIRFTASDETTLLDYERELIETTTEPYQLVMHVRIPSVSSSVDTDYYMFYNNPDETVDGENKTGVWDSNFVMVQHMGDSLADSTINGNDGTNYGTTVVDGLNGKARSFDGVDDYIKVNNIGFNSSEISVQYNINIKTDTGKNYAFDTNNERDPLMKYEDNDPSIVIWGLGVTTYSPYTQGSKLNLWTNYTLKYNGTTEGLYINNVNVDSKTGSEVINFTDLWIGECYLLGYSLNGYINEVRISNIARSGAWIKADDANLRTWDLQSIGVEVATNATEYLAKVLVEDNIISATDTDRNVSILTSTEKLGLGSVQTFESVNEPLLKALEKLLSVDDYGHKITLDGTELTYDVIVPVDRTDSVQFSNKIFNLDEATRTQSSSNYKTFVYFEGTTVTGTYGTDTGLNRIEVFVKDSSTDNTTDRSKQELNGRYYKTDAIDGKIRIVGNPFKYKTDYDLGDYVTVIFDNEVFEVQITEVTETYDNNGFRLDLTFGTPRRDFADMITDIRESEK